MHARTYKVKHRCSIYFTNSFRVYYVTSAAHLIKPGEIKTFIRILKDLCYWFGHFNHTGMLTFLAKHFLMVLTGHLKVHVSRVLATCSFLPDMQ